MKIKEAALKEIHWLLSWNEGQQANDRIREKLGDSLSQNFARVNVGGNAHVWTVNINGKWIPLTNAQPTEEMLVRQRWDEIKQEVRTKLSAEPDLAEKILTIPNEEYVFYQIDAAGQVKVLITGWGSTNHKKPIIGNQRVEVEDKGAHPVSIAFTIDDEKVPNRNFFIVTSLKNVPHTTDANGDYALGKINADTTIEFIDEPTGKRFNILTDRSTPEYTFDITERINVRIEASHDNEPISGEEASIDYHGRTYKVMLEAGQAAMGLALYPGEVCTARFRGAMQQQQLNPAGHTFRFDSNTPPPEPEPEPEPKPEPEVNIKPHLLIQGDKGFIGKEYPISVEYEGKRTDYISNQDGIVELPEMTCGHEMKVTDGYNPGNITTYTLDKDQLEYIFHVPYEPVNDARDISIQAIGLNNLPIAKCGINFKQGEKERVNKLDERGFTYLAKDTFRPAVPMTALISKPERKFPPINFALDEDETEYVLQEVKGEQGFGDYILEILAALGAFIGLIIIFFVAGGAIDLATKAILQFI